MTVDFMPFFSNSKAARLFLLRLDLEKYCEVNNVCVGVPCLAHGVNGRILCQIKFIWQDSKHSLIIHFIKT